jgi:hypothetical protein
MNKKNNEDKENMIKFTFKDKNFELIFKRNTKSYKFFDTYVNNKLTELLDDSICAEFNIYSRSDIKIYCSDEPNHNEGSGYIIMLDIWDKDGGYTSTGTLKLYVDKDFEYDDLETEWDGM